MITSKFGAIYAEDENGKISLYDIVLVDYNMDTDEFVIQTGPFKSLEGNILNLITTNPDDFFNVPSFLDFKEYDEEKDYILLFENDYIDDVTNYFNHDDELTTFAFLANELANIELHKNSDGTLCTKVCKSDIEYTPELLDEKLYSKDNNIPVVDEEDDFSNEENPFNILMSTLFGGSTKVHALAITAPQKEKEKKTYESLLKDLDEIRKKYKSDEKDSDNVNIIDTRKVISNTSRKIVGQENVIKTLVNQIFNNQMIIDELENEEEFDITELDSRKTSILLDGETGTGKTAILKDIAKQLDLPIVIASSTNFSGTGYVGASVTDILQDLLNQTNGDIKKAERGIIVFDEVDKLATNKDYRIGTDVREDVQQELLTFIGGGEYDVPVGGFPFGQTAKFNTSKNTFILSGAFTDLREDKIKEVDKEHNSMGFNIESSDNYEKEYVVTPDDYIKYGLMREFFGRIKVLASTKSYNLEDCKKILLESTISPLLNFEKTVKMYGYPGIEYNEEFLNIVAEEGLKMKTGARGLQTVMSGIQNNMLDGLINHEYEEGKPIKLTTSMIESYKKSFVRKF